MKFFLRIFSYSSNEETINSEQPIPVRMLPATLLAKVSPETEMMGHPWMQGPMPSQEEIAVEFKDRERMVAEAIQYQ